MDNEVREAVKIAIELMIAAVVIGVIATALYFGHSLMNTRNYSETSADILEAQADLYNYTSQTINGSDVLDLIVTYARLYDFAVVDTNGNVLFKRTSENKLDDWSVTSVRKDLADLINDKYTTKEILTTDGGSIQALVFVKGANDLSEMSMNKVASALKIERFSVK